MHCAAFFYNYPKCKCQSDFIHRRWTQVFPSECHVTWCSAIGTSRLKLEVWFFRDTKVQHEGSQARPNHEQGTHAYSHCQSFSCFSYVDLMNHKNRMLSKTPTSIRKHNYSPFFATLASKYQHGLLVHTFVPPHATIRIKIHSVLLFDNFERIQLQIAILS